MVYFFKKLFDFLLIILILIYILFEELVWEKFAKPILQFFSKYLKKFNFFDKFLKKIDSLNPHIVLFIFLLFFVIVEFLGVYAAIIFIKGEIFFATFIYALKIPLAVIILWFFDITKDKLLTFAWFSYLYRKLIKLIELIKNSKIYSLVYEKAAKIKTYFEEKSRLKANFILNKFVDIYKNIRVKLKL